MRTSSKPKPMFSYSTRNMVSIGSRDIYCELVSNQGFKNINNILKSYAEGDFNYVIQHLNINDYNTLAVGLYRLQNLNYPCYEQIRKALTYTLEGLRQCVIQTQLLQQLKEQMAIFKEGYDILHDKELLKEYLERIENNFKILPDATYTAPLLAIRPEYLEYIKLYGFPENLIFDPDKLAEIIAGTNPPQPHPISNIIVIEELPEPENIEETHYNNFEYSSLIDDPSDGTFN